MREIIVSTNIDERLNGIGHIAVGGFAVRGNDDGHLLPVGPQSVRDGSHFPHHITDVRAKGRLSRWLLGQDFSKKLLQRTYC